MDGAKAIAYSLRHNQTILKLHLSIIIIIDIDENSILFEGGRQIIMELETNKTITNLNLCMD